MKNWIFSRMREPSTWSGLGVIASMVGVPATTTEALVRAGVALGGLLAVLMPEAGK